MEQYKLDAIYNKIARKDKTRWLMVFVNDEVQTTGEEWVGYYFLRTPLNPEEIILYTEDKMYYDNQYYIIGHPITLSDVLYKYPFAVDRLCGITWRSPLWDMNIPYLDDQPEECKDYIYNLISQ